VTEPEIITVNKIEECISESIKDADLVLLKTGIEKYRDQERFWKYPPGFSPDICDYLMKRFKSFSAVGMDAISISSFQYREVGRLAHEAFLGSGIRIFEDLALGNITKSTKLKKVIALPFRYKNADGSPATLIGQI